MDIFLVLLASIGILLQYFLEYLNKIKYRKKIIGGVIVVCTLAGLWGSYVVQKDDAKELKSGLDTLKIQNSQLSINLDKRDSSLTKIRSQNEYLIDLMIKLSTDQKEFKILARNINEASRVREVRKEPETQKVNRDISRDIEIKMINYLRAYKGSKISLTSIMGNQEAFAFAKHLKDILSSAGWIVDGVNQGIFTGPIFGTFLKVKSHQYPKRVDVIVDSFKLANIQLEGFIDETVGEDDVQIIVGELKQ
jgi:hypothetical protein